MLQSLTCNWFVLAQKVTREVAARRVVVLKLEVALKPVVALKLAVALTLAVAVKLVVPLTQEVLLRPEVALTLVVLRLVALTLPLPLLEEVVNKVAPSLGSRCRLVRISVVSSLMSKRKMVHQHSKMRMDSDFTATCPVQNMASPKLGIIGFSIQVGKVISKVLV